VTPSSPWRSRCRSRARIVSTPRPRLDRCAARSPCSTGSMSLCSASSRT
jgi:hypothetical protein